MLCYRDHFVEGAVVGLDIWPILALFSIVVLVIATLISHTCVSLSTIHRCKCSPLVPTCSIAAVLLVPIAARLGSGMEVPHPTLLIMATALISSAGMGLPISGFPNLQACVVSPAPSHYR